MEEYKNLSYTEVLKLAESGDTEAMRKVAEAYTNGDSVDKDLEKAFEWKNKAAVLGNMDAQAEWAEICRSTEKFESSFYWEKKAAEQGKPESQYNLGHHYDKGVGTSQNEEQAFYWFKKSAENGYINAKHSLAVCYITGKGTSQDMEKGIYWLGEASKEGHVEAKRRLGAAYIQGMGVSKDEEKGVSLLHDAASLGDEKAKELLNTKEVRRIAGKKVKGVSFITILFKPIFIWLKIILFSIRDFFLFWWKITIFDIDFFRDNYEVPLWSKVIVFFFGHGSLLETIWNLFDKSLGYVVFFFFGYFTSAFVFVFRILFSPITVIVRMIKGEDE